jgi:chemotaxis protein histidine kinase CheA
MVHDDGRGIDLLDVRRRAVASGLLTEAQAAAISDDVAIAALFEPGFSTATTTLDAGRGVGLDVVKSAIIDDLGGEIFVRSEPGKYTSFSFSIPLDAAVGATS